MTRVFAVGSETREESETARQERIAADATKAPIILAKQIVDRHIRELRYRHLIEVPAHTTGLVLTLEQLTHDVASAILDARMASQHTPPTRG